MAKRTYYEIMGISYDADDQEIRRAYRRMIQDYHPDQHPDDHRSARRARHLNAAKDILLDRKKRRRYDQKLRRKGLIPSAKQSWEMNVEKQVASPPVHDSDEYTLAPEIDRDYKTAQHYAAQAKVDETLGDEKLDRWKRHPFHPSQWIATSQTDPAINPRERSPYYSLGLIFLLSILLGLWYISKNPQFRFFQRSNVPIYKDAPKTPQERQPNWYPPADRPIPPAIRRSSSTPRKNDP
ncbi:MAG: DnaJ domain-containing protein [Mariniblastus sp.]|nr:DnaJ domain-containing protein [Mariniblastus sp.]